MVVPGNFSDFEKVQSLDSAWDLDENLEFGKKNHGMVGTLPEINSSLVKIGQRKIHLPTTHFQG